MGRRTCEVGQKSLAFLHRSKTFTRGKFLICDLQGEGHNFDQWMQSIFVISYFLFVRLFVF